MSADILTLPGVQRRTPVLAILPDFSAPREQIARIDEARHVAVIQLSGEFDVERCRRVAFYFEKLARKLEAMGGDNFPGGPNAA